MDISLKIMQAKKEKKIPESDRELKEFLKLKHAATVYNLVFLFFGISMMPAIISRFTKHITDQRRRGVIYVTTGLAYFILLSPRQTNREKELIKILEFRYEHVLQNITFSSKRPQADNQLNAPQEMRTLPRQEEYTPLEYSPREEQQMDVSYYRNPTPARNTYQPVGLYSDKPAVPSNQFHTYSPAPMNPYREPSLLSPSATEYTPYMVPVASSQPYVYGSMSSKADRSTDRRQ